jgi:hypothetical protein
VRGVDRSFILIPSGRTAALGFACSPPCGLSSLLPGNFPSIQTPETPSLEVSRAKRVTLSKTTDRWNAIQKMLETKSAEAVRLDNEAKQRIARRLLTLREEEEEEVFAALSLV